MEVYPSLADNWRTLSLHPSKVHVEVIDRSWSRTAVARISYIIPQKQSPCFSCLNKFPASWRQTRFNPCEKEWKRSTSLQEKMNIDQHVHDPLSTWFLLSLLKSSEVCRPHMNHHQSSSIYLILFLFSIVFHFSTERREKSAVSSLGYSCQWLAIASTCAAGGSLKRDMTQETTREGWWILSWGTFPYKCTKRILSLSYFC